MVLWNYLAVCREEGISVSRPSILHDLYSPNILSTTNWQLPWALAIYLYKDYQVLLRLLIFNTP